MATNDKYDRQLRLWGAHGQKALMESHILLINADGVGTETMKNLVLPGVGNITILDDKIVTELDYGNNFFVEPSSFGKSRADVVKELLCEMNPDVIGFAINDTLKNVMNADSSFLSKFSLIISGSYPSMYLSISLSI
jgi:amyloid beta precursor protein binding protein 1